MTDHTMVDARMEMGRDANNEAMAIVALLKEKFCDLDVSDEDMLLMRGLVHRLDTLTDVVFESIFNGHEYDDLKLAKMLDTLV